MTSGDIAKDHFCPLCGENSTSVVVWVVEEEVFKKSPKLGSKAIEPPRRLECKGCGLRFSPAPKNTRIRKEELKKIKGLFPSRFPCSDGANSRGKSEGSGGGGNDGSGGGSSS